MKDIFLDLDGTLIDSSKGLLESFAYVFEQLGKETPSREELQLYLGPVLKWSLKHLYHMEPELIPRACEIYHERYDAVGVYEYTVFPGTPQMLKKLKQAGANLYIATAKDRSNAEVEMREEGLTDLFAGMYGAGSGASIVKKEQVLAKALEERGIRGSEAVMVGDRGSDLQAGRIHGMVTIAALYGFGSKEELLGENPDYAVRSVEELEALLLKLVKEND